MLLLFFFFFFGPGPIISSVDIWWFIDLGSHLGCAPSREYHLELPTDPHKALVFCFVLFFFTAQQS